MDRTTDKQQPVARQEFLRVTPAQHIARRRSVTPITLERRWISMEGPSSTSSPSIIHPTTTETTTSINSLAPGAPATTNVTDTTTTAASPGSATNFMTTEPSKDQQRQHDKGSTAVSSDASTPMSTSSTIDTTNTTTGSTRHPAVQTSNLAPDGATAAAGPGVSNTRQQLVSRSPLPFRRLVSSASPATAAAATTTLTTKPPTQADLGGKQRPGGAHSPTASLKVRTGSGDGGARTAGAPHGLEKDAPGTTSGNSATRKQATQEELKTPQQGQKQTKETDTLSTGDQHTTRQPSRATTSHSERGREPTRRRGGAGRLAVQFSDNTPSSSPRPSPRDIGHVMQFFEEQEKSLQESFLSLPKKGVKKQRSPSPKVSPAAGLEHLDNLVRLMEQLGSLKDENSRLRQRCHYLESTKLLLQARKDLATFEAGGAPARFQSMTVKQQKQGHPHHHHHHHHHPKKAEGDSHGQREMGTVDVVGSLDGEEEARPPHLPGARRSRISSAEELDFLYADSSSDQRPKRSKSGLQKRSFSTGSLEVPSELLLGDVSEKETRKRIKLKTGRGIFSSKSGSKSKSSKSGSKWARVKMVLKGQKIYEDLGTTIRTIRDLGRSSGSHSRQSASGGGLSVNPHDISPPSSHVSSGLDPRHTDSGLGLGSSTQDGGTAGASPKPPLVVVPFMSYADTDPASRSEQEGSDNELTCDIWMGPPDWWEEYEARTEGSGRRRRRDDDDDGGVGGDGAGCGASTTNSDVSSVIEVTTMYLGSAKKDTLAPYSSASSPTALSSSALTASTISSSSTATPLGPMTPAASASVSGDQQFLTVEKFPLSRRQSSPSLNGREASEEGDDILDELASLSESPTRPLHKSSSCQSADLELPRSSEFSGSDSRVQSQKAKGYRTAWGRVKDIIHTRKDSVKRRPKKQRGDFRTGVENEDSSEIDVESLCLEEQWLSGSFAEGLLGRSTPKSSPMVIRQHSQQGPPPSTQGSQSAPGKAGPSEGLDMAAMLASNMSDEFNKKMMEWEAKKSRKVASFRAPVVDSDMGSLDASSASQDIPVQTVDLKDLKGKVPDSSSDGTTPGESHTSLEVLGAHTASPAQLEEVQRRMTDSFSRKMQEWEKLKNRSSQSGAREPSPEMERKGSKGRKDDRQKSKRSREDKEKEKLEKMREREMQKVEKEQVKLEKEKLRLEKERLRALEREAKLEKIKGRLSSTEADTGFKNPVLGPLAEYKVTADFAHKLHQWELKKGLSHDVSNSIYLEAQKLSMQHLRETETSRRRLTEETQSGEEGVDGEKGLSAGWDTFGERSLLDKYPPEVGLEEAGEDADAERDTEGEADGDNETSTSLTEECHIKSNIVTLERANEQLIENLQQKELEYDSVQQQVTEVNRKLAKVKEEHAREMARFQRELALGSIADPVKLEVGQLESTISTMSDKIKAMENLGERLALSMESAAVGKWQSIDGEEQVHTQLVELVDQMRNMLVQASHSEEESKKSMALTNFEKLYSHAMKLQVQMNNLRLSHLERNREIMTVKRQLLLQEVNNLLLQADITRRETELYQYQAAKKFASLRRWNTFSGSERARPQAQMEITPKPSIEMLPDGRSRPVDAPHVNIPYIPEDVIMASAASSSLSAPASPSAVEAASGIPLPTPSGGSLHPHHQQQQHVLAPTTSSAAGGSPSYSVSPMTLSATSAAGHHQQQSYHHHTTQQQREPHHSSMGAAIDQATTRRDDYNNPDMHLLTPPTSPLRDSHTFAAPASPSLIRAVSDPQQGKGKPLLEKRRKELEVSASLAPEFTPTSSASSIHPTAISRSASDGESLTSKSQPSTAPFLETTVSSLSTQDARPPLKGCAMDDHGGQAGLFPGQDQQPKLSPTQSLTSSSSKATLETPLRSAKATSRRTELTTMSDSAPLYKEIRELKKAKSIVEKGSPTLILSKEGKGSSSAPSPGKSPSRRPSRTSKSGTPAQSIPRQRSLDLAYPTAQVPKLTRAAASIDDDDSPASTVMTCTISAPDQPRLGLDTESGTVGASARLSPRSDGRRDLPPTSDSSRTGSTKCPRSPVTKHNYLRRQKEERDTAASSGRHVDYKAISPKGSPVLTRGKPPLPRQNTPVRQSPQASPATPEKGPRSKSVGEMSHGTGGSAASAADTVAHKPLQDAINKFEKRQTMCETEERPVELRKTPSPTLHLPRVGLVSRVRRLKPAAELLEESQRYRSGHTIYATRIMQRYLPKEESKSPPPDGADAATAATSVNQTNKENTFVHAMVRRLSRETSPIKSTGSSRTNSDLSLKRTDSPRSNTEFVSHIVRKLSGGSGSGSPRYRTNSALSPFKDRTNDVQVKKMTQSFDDVTCSPERTLSDSEIGRDQPQPGSNRRYVASSQSTTKTQHRKSCEVAMVLSASSAAPTESSNKMMSSSLPAESDQLQQQTQQPQSSDLRSLPALSSPQDSGLSRSRAATYCASEEKRQTEGDSQPTRPASTLSDYDPRERKLSSTSIRGRGGQAGRTPTSSLSPVRRGVERGKMGTVGVLCKQSISFDLGVSLYTRTAEAAGSGSPKSTRQVRSWDPSESAKAEAAVTSGEAEAARAMTHSAPGPSHGATTSGESLSFSSSCEGDQAPSSPNSEEKNKFRRFLDSNWLQKSKKFFKVSK